MKQSRASVRTLAGEVCEHMAQLQEPIANLEEQRSKNSNNSSNPPSNSGWVREASGAHRFIPGEFILGMLSDHITKVLNFLMIKRLSRIAWKATLVILLAISLDMIIGRSVYHPLVYLYKLVSFSLCQPSAISCKYHPLHAPSGQAAISTAHREATQVGIKILAQGGNAIDAAVAISYALATVHPCCGNLGGGGFMTIRLANGKNAFINFREMAPQAATATLYQDSKGEVVKGLSTEGYLAVGVPGSVAGLEYARAHYGSGYLSRSELIEPARKLAEKGFILTEQDARLLKGHTKMFRQDPDAAKIFLNQGRAFKAGERLIQKDLAKTLEQIAKNGEKAFYEGEIAQSIVRDSQKSGGILSKADFITYQVEEDSPLTCEYRGYTVLTTPPPGGGSVLCQMLGIIEGFPVSQEMYHSERHLHWLLSAMFFAYRDRNAYFGDPNFVDVPLEKILSEDYLASLRNQVPEQTALTQKSNSLSPDSEGGNTTHFSVVDDNGNAVSVTTTINTLFGAGVIADGTGFFLNNEMDDFTTRLGSTNSYGLEQGIANQIEPGKRPLSSMSPTIVVGQTGQLFLVTGSPGGSTIPTTVFQIIDNMINFEMTGNEAINKPRLHYQGTPNIVISEPFALRGSTFLELWKRGYRVVPFPTWGAAMSVESGNDDLESVQDIRRPQGQAAVLE